METIFAVQPEYLPTVAEAMRRSFEINARESLQLREPAISQWRNGSVLVLLLYGFITYRTSLLSFFLGGTNTEAFSKQLRAAVQDQEVDTILIEADSPGGGIQSIQELSDEIYRARSKKRIVAAVNGGAFSAAYWIISSAHEISITPSGGAGSIGVFGIHYDHSRANEIAGIKPTYISAGKYKVEGNQDNPLDSEAVSHMQKRVNEYYTAFVEAVARGRKVTAGKVRGGFAEGRAVGAAEAVRLGMADKVETFSETINRIASPQTSRLSASRTDPEIEAALRRYRPIDSEMASTLQRYRPDPSLEERQMFWRKEFYTND